MSERRNLVQESLAAIERLKARLDASERAKHEPIAIIGAGCRYPGGIEDLESLWRVVRDGVDAVSDVPQDRWDVDAYYDPDPKAPGKMVTRRGGFLAQLDRFDAQFFGISPRETTTMDPQQRLLLETAYDAIESAGLAADRLAGSSTGVFVGITTSDYGQLLRIGDPENSDVYSATGNALNAAAGRLSFALGLQGPCVAVDTACSSSLVAVHLACQSLRSGESDLALAGGVNVILTPNAMVLFSKWGMLAPDGACKTFDATADGFVRGEGCAVIALKRLSDALAAHDPILAVIRGSAVNSDGRSSGLTVPSGPAQQLVLRKALADALLTPADIDYVEAHGTGTSLGDPIEVEALGAVMCNGRSGDRPLLIGSIKTNLGHTEAASGLAGLLKVVMALVHESVPPHLHFSVPNPGIPWAGLQIKVPTALTPWPRREGPRRAGVSSFGFSGTNAHVILEEAPPPQPVKSAPPLAVPLIIPLSARDDTAIRELSLRYADFLAAEATLPLADVAVTAGTGRVHLARRLALLADSTGDLQRDLRSFASGEVPAGAFEGTIRAGDRPKVAFLFTGQGAQYQGMGRSLYDSEPVFRSVLDRAAEILAPYLPRPLLQVLYTGEGNATELSNTAYTQPALFALEYALAQLWRSWGITPAIVAGHSVGEYAAACVSGVFSFEDGLALIAERGRLMQALPNGGGMAAVFTDEANVAARLGECAGRVAIAAVNGPEETVVSGEAGSVSKLLADFAADGVKGRMLDVSHAFHSGLLDPMLDAYERRASEVSHAAPHIPLMSNLTGAAFPVQACPDATYWRRHAREPVRFAACVNGLRAAGVTALVEVGPHPTLLALAARAARGAPWSMLASLRQGRDDRREMLSALAALYAKGAAVQWDALAAREQGRRIALPTYPFQRERYWFTPKDPPARASAQPGHPLLGARHELASSPGTYVWDQVISLETYPWLRDHCVQGVAIVPATAYIEMAIAAGGEILGSGSLSLRHIENLKPLTLHDGMERDVQTTLVAERDGAAHFAVHSRPSNRRAKAVSFERWTAHATAQIAIIDSPGLDGQKPAPIEIARARCGREIDGARFYGDLEKKGNEWGPCFRGMDHVWLGEREAVGRIHVPVSLLDEAVKYRFHPAVSDACGHTLVAVMPLEHTNDATGGALVGGGVGEVRFHHSPAGATLWTHARLRWQTDGERNVVIGDVTVYDEFGGLVSETFEARLWYLDERPESDPAQVPSDWYYQVVWQPQTLAGLRMRGAAAGSWLVFADQSGVASEIMARRKLLGAKTILVTPGDSWSFDGDRATIRPDDPEHYVRLLDSVGHPAAIIHLWSLDTAKDFAAMGSMAQALAAGPESLLTLVHSLRAAASHPRPRLWLVTRDAQTVLPGDTCNAPWAAALWGLGRSLSVEHAEFWGGLIDLASGSASQAAESLIREISEATVEDKIAFRGSRRYVARLSRWNPSARNAGQFLLNTDASYVITGGLGGIGLAMAGWLAERGARHMLLVGRTPLPPRDSWAGFDPASKESQKIAAILDLESRGADVETAAIDIAIEGQLERCLEERRLRGAPPVRGIIHAAGVVQFEALATQDIASLRSGLAAKMQGAWRLHRLFLFIEEQLDFFVLCSSTSALLTSPLLGGYAAGNAFLDALAHHRHARGLPGLSINWGTWGEVGMAAADRRSGNGTLLRGASTISTARGLAALGQLLEADNPQAAVMPVEWQELSRAYPAFAADPFLTAMVEEIGRKDNHPAATTGPTIAALVATPAQERPEALRAYLQAEVARLLGFATERLDAKMPLSSLGFDSLMAVQLKNRIESDLGATVPMIQFLDGPSVEQLVPSIVKAMDAGLDVSAACHGKDETVWEEGTL